jgi:hypothetical protein
MNAQWLSGSRNRLAVRLGSGLDVSRRAAVATPLLRAVGIIIWVGL